MSAAKVQPIRPAPEGVISAAAVDSALNAQACVVYQVLGIIKLASQALQDAKTPEDGAKADQAIATVWGALDGAYTLLNGVVDNLESCDALLAKEISHD